MIIVRKYLTATTSDVLADTDLASIPNNGVLTIYSASDQLDSTITVTGTNIVPPYNQTPIEQRTSSVIAVNEMIPARVPATRGGQVTIAVTEVTAATIQVLVIWTPR